jgi:hypothetical protein
MLCGNIYDITIDLLIIDTDNISKSHLVSSQNNISKSHPVRSRRNDDNPTQMLQHEILMLLVKNIFNRIKCVLSLLCVLTLIV